MPQSYLSIPLLGILVLGSAPQKNEPVDAAPLPPGAVFRIGTPQVWFHRAVDDIAFSPDGKLLAVRANDLLQLLDVMTGKELRRWQGQISNHGLAFLPDGKTVASIRDHEIVLWNVATGAARTRSIGHAGLVPKGVSCQDDAPEPFFMVSGCRAAT